MIITFGNWNLSKASSDEKTVDVRMVANGLGGDRESEEILPVAFNKATTDYFLREGIIDWHHQSVLGKTQAERAASILGKPRDFQWENKLPTVYARLTKAHPIVANSILPHLEADQNVFGASVGGSVKKAKNIFDEGKKKLKTVISEIVWNALSIAALPYVICPGTAVSLVKALGGSADELCVSFSDCGQFAKSDLAGIMARENEFMKALTVGAGTDSAALTGASAMRSQSLEGGPVPRSAIIDEVILGITDGHIEPTAKAIVAYLERKGVRPMEVDKVLDELRKAIRTFISGKQPY